MRLTTVLTLSNICKFVPPCLNLYCPHPHGAFIGPDTKYHVFESKLNWHTSSAVADVLEITDGNAGLKIVLSHRAFISANHYGGIVAGNVEGACTG